MTERKDAGVATRSSPRGQARRRVILDSAVKLFSAGGFNSASIADIAADVGMTQAGLLHHFPSKSALLLAVLQEREERNSLAQMDSQQTGGLDYLSAFLGTLQTNEQAPALVQLFAVLSAESITEEHPAHDWFVNRYRDTVAKATKEMAELIDETRLPAGATAETVARWILGAADGLRLQWLLDPDALDRVESMSQLIEVFRPYMRHPEMPIAPPRKGEGP